VQPGTAQHPSGGHTEVLGEGALQCPLADVEHRLDMRDPGDSGTADERIGDRVHKQGTRVGIDRPGPQERLCFSHLLVIRAVTQGGLQRTRARDQRTRRLHPIRQHADTPIGERAESTGTELDPEHPSAPDEPANEDLGGNTVCVQPTLLEGDVHARMRQHPSLTGG